MSSFLKATLPSDEEEDQDFIPSAEISENEQETIEEKGETSLKPTPSAVAIETKAKVEDIWNQLKQNTLPKAKRKPSRSNVTKKETSNTTLEKISVSKKRPKSGVNAFLESLQKKKKVNVLEKTKSDWKGFKAMNKEDEEELKAHRKSSNQYLEKTEFLDRVAQKEHEIKVSKKPRQRQ